MGNFVFMLTPTKTHIALFWRHRSFANLVGTQGRSRTHSCSWQCVSSVHLGCLVWYSVRLGTNVTACLVLPCRHFMWPAPFVITNHPPFQGLQIKLLPRDDNKHNCRQTQAECERSDGSRHNPPSYPEPANSQPP